MRIIDANFLYKNFFLVLETISKILFPLNYGTQYRKTKIVPGALTKKFRNFTHILGPKFRIKAVIQAVFPARARENCSFLFSRFLVSSFKKRKKKERKRKIKRNRLDTAILNEIKKSQGSSTRHTALGNRKIRGAMNG